MLLTSRKILKFLTCSQELFPLNLKVQLMLLMLDYTKFDQVCVDSTKFDQACVDSSIVCTINKMMIHLVSSATELQ